MNMATLKISDIMSEDVITIDSDNGIEDAANLMVRADVSGSACSWKMKNLLV